MICYIGLRKCLLFAQLNLGLPHHYYTVAHKGLAGCCCFLDFHNRFPPGSKPLHRGENVSTLACVFTVANVLGTWERYRRPLLIYRYAPSSRLHAGASANARIMGYGVQGYHQLSSIISVFGFWR